MGTKKKYLLVGEYKPPDEEGNGEVIKKAFFRQGMIFKDEDAFYNRVNDVCYIAELSDVTYTKQDFLRICNGQKEIARMIFDAVDWQHPETYLDEQYVNGELDVCKSCDKIFESYGVEKCPHCGAKYEKEGE